MPIRDIGSVCVTYFLIGGVLILALFWQLGDEVYFVMGTDTTASVGRVVAIHMTTDLRVSASSAHRVLLTTRAADVVDIVRSCAAGPEAQRSAQRPYDSA